MKPSQTKSTFFTNLVKNWREDNCLSNKKIKEQMKKNTDKSWHTNIDCANITQSSKDGIYCIWFSFRNSNCMVITSNTEVITSILIENSPETILEDAFFNAVETIKK